MTMLLLFPIVLVSYAAMHVYMGFKLCRAFPRLKQWTALLVIATTLLFAGPFLARWLGNRQHIILAMLARTVGYTWIAVVFWFFSMGLILDAWNLLMRVASLFFAGAARWHIPARRAVPAVGLIIVLAFAWGWAEARLLHVETLVIRTDRLPEGKTYSIAQISDLHLTAGRGGRLAAKILNAVMSLNPDIIVSTGDLVDSPARQLQQEAGLLRLLYAPGGRFAVLGNHEYFTGLSEALSFHEAAGFTLLRGTALEALPGLWLAGVDDPAGRFMHQPLFNDERPLAAGRPEEEFVLLLKHQPLVSRQTGAWYDLQLSGHTHGGQLFPFEWLLKPIYPFRRGLHEVAPGRRLYVNRGAGTWGPPLRLFARPEITLITLEGAGPR